MLIASSAIERQESPERRSQAEASTRRRIEHANWNVTIEALTVQIQIKRVYERPAPTDGLRVLVDRLWPRGLTKKDAAIDFWAKDLAPSDELRKWFAHQDERFAEFTRRYHVELDSATVEVERLLRSVGDGIVTLLYAASNTTSNHAIVLQSQLEKMWS